MAIEDANKIKFYPFSDSTKNFTPEPVPASRVVPQWYKDQPGSINEEMALPTGNSTGTVKRCMPIFDIMTAGYILKLPMDIYMDATNPAQLQWSLPGPMKQFQNEFIATHDKMQYEKYPIDRDMYHHQLFRVMPFYSVQTPPGYSTLFIHPQHQDDVPFKSFSGFVDTDNFITDGHFSMLIKKGFKGIIPQGTAILQAIPIKRDDWSMEIMEVKDTNAIVSKQRLNLRSVFKTAYKDKMRVKKEFR
jgi:hypothetical protein